MQVRSLATLYVLALLLTIALVPATVLAQDGVESGPDAIEWWWNFQQGTPFGQTLSDLLKDTIFPDGEPGNPDPPGPPFTPGTIGGIASNFPKDVGGSIGGTCTPNCPAGLVTDGPNAARLTQAVPETGATLLIAIGALFVVVVFGAPRRAAQAPGLPARWQIDRSAR